MVMVGRERRDDGSAQPVSLRVRQLESGPLLKMVVQQPGVVKKALQDQRLPAGDRAALAPHDRACRELRTCRLIGAAGRSPRTLWTAIAPGAEPAGILSPAG